MNWQEDMRARLFRERNPAAFHIVTATNAPVLEKVPLQLTSREAGDIAARALTAGEEDFRSASKLVSSGKTNEAVAAFHQLRRNYTGTWIDRVSAERLAKLEPVSLAAKYPGDAGIENDPDVFFADNFESGDMK